MNEQAESERLRAKRQELRESLTQALEELSQMKEALRLALARMEEREKHHKPPEFVTENGKKRPAEEKKPGKKREGKHHRGRSPGRPIQIVEHRVPSAICGWVGSAWSESET
ncbi:MAG TPA: hypothetical protein VGF67_07140 [Ktedonobacteraceae bacterium]|jgi:hypothetical protein